MTILVESLILIICLLYIFRQNLKLQIELEWMGNVLTCIQDAFKLTTFNVVV